MAEPLQIWAPRVSGALERVGSVSIAAIRRRATAAATAAGRRAPSHLHVTASTTGAVDSGTVALRAVGAGAALLDRGGVAHGHPWIAVPTGPRVSAPGPSQDGRLFAMRLRDGRVFLASHRGGALDLRWRLVRQTTHRGLHYLDREAETAAAEVPEVIAGAIAHELGVRR